MIVEVSNVFLGGRFFIQCFAFLVSVTHYSSARWSLGGSEKLVSRCDGVEDRSWKAGGSSCSRSEGASARVESDGTGLGMRYCKAVLLSLLSSPPALRGLTTLHSCPLPHFNHDDYLRRCRFHFHNTTPNLDVDHNLNNITAPWLDCDSQRPVLLLLQLMLMLTILPL